MDGKLQRKLFERYTFLTRSWEKERNSPCKHPFSLFAIECGDGWFKLLWDLMGQIEKSLVKISWSFSIQFPWQMSSKNYKFMWFDKVTNDISWQKQYIVYQLRLYFINFMWVKIIDRSEYENFQVTQIKEKFGGLRFYYGGGNDKVFKLTQKAENKSYKICESCGKPGKPNSDGWIITLCRGCRKKYDEDRL